MQSPALERASRSSSPEPLRKDSVSSSISLLLNVDDKAVNQGMDALAKAAFSAEPANDRQLKPIQSQIAHLPTPQSPVVSFPPIMVSREDGNYNPSPNVERWSRSSSSSVRDSQSPPSTNATVPALISRSGYGSFPLKSASTDDLNASSGDKPFVCKECDQTFSRPHNLKSHLATHSAERPYQCEVCLHQFRRHHDLKRHQKLHTGERPYVCNVCDRSFARLDALNRHRRAEGGSACNSTQNQRRLSQPQPQNANVTSNHRRESQDTDTSSVVPATRTRPNVPELQIPHPESRPFDQDHSGRRSLSIDEQHTQGYRPEERPSPFRAATYPDPNSAAGSSRPVVLPPPQGTSQPPQPSQREKQLEQRIALLQKRNRDLESQLERSLHNNNSSDLERFKSRVHDLEVENKVLRSLILQNKDTMDIPTKKRRFLEASTSSRSSGSPGATEDIEMRDTAEAY